MNQLEHITDLIRDREAISRMRSDTDFDRKRNQQLKYLQSIYVSAASYEVFKVDGLYEDTLYFLDSGELTDYINDFDFDLGMGFTVDVVEMKGIDLGQLGVIE